MEKNIKIYGSRECQRCADAKKALDSQQIAYEYVDVLSSLEALKQFINIRDKNPELFKQPISEGHIGLPVFVIDGRYYHGAIDEFDINLFTGGGCDAC